jgi:hypothetical protein
VFVSIALRAWHYRLCFVLGFVATRQSPYGAAGTAEPGKRGDSGDQASFGVGGKRRPILPNGGLGGGPLPCDDPWETAQSCFPADLAPGKLRDSWGCGTYGSVGGLLRERV